MRCIWLVALGGLITLAAQAVELHREPGLIAGPNECGECHEAEVEAWRGTHHYRSFKELPRREKAREIADKLGLKRIKHESACLGCHFTVGVEDKQRTVMAGVSCESCHGAGMEWIDVHSGFGPNNATKDDETPAHRAQRWQRSEDAGMIRPGDLYALAENCYQCHTVPNEELVNVGGHAAGSDFELVTWSQGEIRHRLWYNDASANPVATVPRQRVMYVVGQMLDLEYGLRGVARATQRDRYAVAMAQRAQRAALSLKALVDAGLQDPRLDAVLNIAGQVRVSLNNAEPLTTAAEQVQAQARAFAESADGQALAVVDAFLPQEFQGEPYQP